jgi:hypothetical protein
MYIRLSPPILDPPPIGITIALGSEGGHATGTRRIAMHHARMSPAIRSVERNPRQPVNSLE